MIKDPNGKGVLLGYLVMSIICIYLIVIFSMIIIDEEIDEITGLLYTTIGILSVILILGVIFAPYEIHKARIEQNEYKKFINYNKKRRGK